MKADQIDQALQIFPSSEDPPTLAGLLRRIFIFELFQRNSSKPSKATGARRSRAPSDPKKMAAFTARCSGATGG